MIEKTIGESLQKQGKWCGNNIIITTYDYDDYAKKPSNAVTRRLKALRSQARPRARIRMTSRSLHVAKAENPQSHAGAKIRSAHKQADRK